jgi:hypothetical protein
MSAVAVCSAPRGLAYQAPTLWVACAGGELVEVSSGAVQSSRHIADDLRDVVTVNDGLLLTTFRHAQVLHLDFGGQLTALTNDDPFQPTDPIGEGPIDAGGGDFDAGGPGDVDAGPPFSGGPQFNRRIAWRMVPYGNGAFMTYQREQATQLLSFGGACTGGSYGAVFDQLPTLHTGLNAVVDGGFIEIDSFNERDMVLPVDVAVSNGGQVALVSAGTSMVDLYAITDPLSRMRVQASGRPTSVAFSGEELVVFVREPAALEIYTSANANPTRLSLGGDSVASSAHDIFHQATTNQIACASCHPEAGDDGHVWQLSNGARRTPSLRGGLSTTKPFHWSGDEADMPSLLSDVLVGRMNGPMESADRTQALLDWLDAQAVLPAPPQDPSAVMRGQSHFLTLCASCHAGAQGTDNLTVDVGTGGAFQVPRLHELWYRAPFMHDGRAATLRDRFGTAGGTSHADVSALSQSDLDDLLAYLQTR